MAELNLPAQPSLGRRLGQAAVSAPRIFLSWEDWFTLAALAVCTLSVAVSVQQAEWVDRMPALVPTVLVAMLTGLLAARTRVRALLLHPFLGLAVGAAVVALAAQSYADGATLADRLADVRYRMEEWYHVVIAGDISTDNLPFVILVHAATYAAVYVGTWVTFRWHNPWPALIPAGVVLLLNISLIRGEPSTPFFFFLVGGLLLVSRLYLQGLQAQWRRTGVPYPDFVSLNVAQSAVLLSVLFVAVAWSLPLGKQASAAKSVGLALLQPFETFTDDVVRLFSNVNLQFARGSNFHKFQSVLPIRGNVDLGERVLYEVAASQAGFLYATSYDTYTGSGWRATDRDTTRIEGGQLPELAEEDLYDLRAVVTVSVTLASEESTLLFPGSPLGTNRDAVVEFAEEHPGDIVQVRSRRVLRPGDTYNAVGSVSVASPDDLRRAGTEYPQWVRDRYLQLPDELPERVAAEARRVAGDAATPYDAAVRIEEYLRSFPFDPSVPAPPPGSDAVDFFLFELRRGYFDYQASAMAVMLRSLGIPARVAVGYALDPADRNGPNFVVRKDDAYSWVEVFFPNYGWVPFNPTADRPSGADFAGIDGLITPSYEDLITLEELFPIDPNLTGEFGAPGGIGEALQETPVDAPEGPPWPLIWSLAALALALTAAAVFGRLAWNWGLGELHPTVQLWAKTERLARWAGIRPATWETPREFARRLGGTIRRRTAAETLAAAYEEARYGPPDLERTEASAARRAYAAVRSALLKRILRVKEEAREDGDDGSPTR